MTLIDSPGTAAAAETRRIWRVLLIDPQRIFRQALRILLGTEPDFTVIGDAGERGEALAMIDALRPDIVITDLRLGEESGLQHIEEIHARFPQVAILVLTASRAHDVAREIRRTGALGYLLKDQGREELQIALREVAAGRRYRSAIPAVRVGRTPPNASSLGSRAVYLTERQRQVLRSLALGYGTRDIAQMLGVSVRAVHKQRERLRHALQLHSTAALTRFAEREGLAQEATPPA